MATTSTFVFDALAQRRAFSSDPETIWVPCRTDSGVFKKFDDNEDHHYDSSGESNYAGLAACFPSSQKRLQTAAAPAKPNQTPSPQKGALQAFPKKRKKSGTEKTLETVQRLAIELKGETVETATPTHWLGPQRKIVHASQKCSALTAAAQTHLQPVALTQALRDVMFVLGKTPPHLIPACLTCCRAEFVRVLDFHGTCSCACPHCCGGDAADDSNKDADDSFEKLPRNRKTKVPAAGSAKGSAAKVVEEASPAKDILASDDVCDHADHGDHATCELAESDWKQFTAGLDKTCFAESRAGRVPLTATKLKRRVQDATFLAQASSASASPSPTTARKLTKVLRTWISVGAGSIADDVVPVDLVALAAVCHSLPGVDVDVVHKALRRQLGGHAEPALQTDLFGDATSVDFTRLLLTAVLLAAPVASTVSLAKTLRWCVPDTAPSRLHAAWTLLANGPAPPSVANKHSIIAAWLAALGVAASAVQTKAKKKGAGKEDGDDGVAAVFSLRCLPRSGAAPRKAVKK